MEEPIDRKKRLTNIVDGIIILAVVFFLCTRFRGSSLFVLILFVSIPFGLYALKIIIKDGLLTK